MVTKETGDGMKQPGLACDAPVSTEHQVLVSFSALKRGRRKVWFSSGAVLHTTDRAPMETMASNA